MIKKIKLFFIVNFCYVTLNSCVGGGTHGEIKGYNFSRSKTELQKKISEVINKTPNIYRDTSDHNYYNDGINYVTIKIKKENDSAEYVFRYYGDEYLWKNSPDSSSIFICYAYGKNNQGGKDGDPKLTPEIRARLIKLFENDFIKKIQ